VKALKILIGVSVVLGGLWYLFAPSPSPIETSSKLAPVNARYGSIYSFSFQRTINLGDSDDSNSETSVEGTIKIVEESRTEDKRLERYELSGLSELSLSSENNTQEILTDERKSMLLGGGVFISRDSLGEITEVRIEPKTPTARSRILEQLAQESTVLAIGKTQNQIERSLVGMLGVAQTHFRREASNKTTKFRSRYQNIFAFPKYQEGMAQELDSAATIILSPDGKLESISEDEQIQIFDAEGKRLANITLKFQMNFVKKEISDATFNQKSFNQLQPMVSMKTPKARMRQELLIKRVSGLTADQILADILRYAKLGKSDKHERWLWRATGLLSLHPEVAIKLAELIRKNKELNSKTISLVTDLLSSVGNQECQTALVDIFSQSHVKAGENYGYQLQGTVRLESPEASMVGFMEDLHQNQADRNIRISAANALGSYAGRLARSDQSEKSSQLVRMLQTHLSQERDEDVQRGYLLALGNAGTEDILSSAREYVASEDPSVRGAAVRSLRKLDGEARQMLWEVLKKDEDSYVRGQAIRSLGQKPLNEAEITQILSLVRTGKIESGNFHHLLNAARKGVSQSQQRLLYQEMLATKPPDALVARIQQRLNKLR